MVGVFNTHPNTHPQRHRHKCMQIYTDPPERTLSHVRAHIYTHIHTFIHTHTHTLTHRKCQGSWRVVTGLPKCRGGHFKKIKK